MRGGEFTLEVAQSKDSEMTQKLHQLGMLIRLHRMRRGISQKQLAQLAGIRNNTISRYELGKLDPNFTALYRIANALGISVSELLRFDSVEL
jgi:transcriptional regulator with XRE-family HTH domain